MDLTTRVETIHSNRGKEGLVVLQRHEVQTIQMKTKTKEAEVKVPVVSVPKDMCYSRLDNWRGLLKSERQIRIVEDHDKVVRIDLWVGKDDPQEWDSHPLSWQGEGWVPFFFSYRLKGE